MKVYIAGPMSGLIHFNYGGFAVAAWGLRGHGFEVVSPTEIHPDTFRIRAHYMQADISALLDCQMVFALPGWEKSRGARLEVDLAEQTGRPVFQISDNTMTHWRDARDATGKRHADKPEHCTCQVCAP